MVVDDKLILKQIWTCLFLPLKTVAWRPLILAYDLVFDTIETITACFETEGKWRIVFSNRFVLGKTVLLYVKSFWTPKPLKCLSSIRAPVRCRFLCAAGGAFRSVPCSSLVTNRRTSIHTLPMSIPVCTTATYMKYEELECCHATRVSNFIHATCNINKFFPLLDILASWN